MSSWALSAWVNRFGGEAGAVSDAFKPKPKAGAPPGWEAGGRGLCATAVGTAAGTQQTVMNKHVMLATQPILFDSNRFNRVPIGQNTLRNAVVPNLSKKPGNSRRIQSHSGRGLRAHFLEKCWATGF